MFREIFKKHQHEIITPRIKWGVIKTPKDLLAHIIATFFGSGLTVLIPGTFGTAGAMIAFYFANNLDTTARIGLLIAILIIGTWAATRTGKLQKISDHPAIVIDEVLGYGIASFMASTNITYLTIAFILFRIFDTIKIPPISTIDRWSKKQKGWKAGLGVMMDDALAGIIALTIFYILASKAII